MKAMITYSHGEEFNHTFRDFLEKVYIFLITYGKFDSRKVFCLGEINENVNVYGNHYQVYTV